MYKRPKTGVKSHDEDYEEKVKEIEKYKKISKALEKRGLF